MKRLARLALLPLSLIAVLAAKDARASALDKIARELAQAVGDVPQGATVVAAPLVSDMPATKGDELAARLAALFAGRVGKGAKPSERVAPLAVARTQAKDSAALLFVTPVLEKGQLRATVDVYPVPHNGWDRIRTPVPAPRAHGYATSAIDAEVRAFLPPILLEQAQIVKARIDDADVLAAACGDVDGDGGLEIALVSRAKVTLGRFSRGRFVAQKSASWSALAPRVPVPLREPLGTATFVEEDRLLVGTTDRGGVALDRELSPVAKLRGLPLAAATEACASLVPEASALEGATTCSTLGDASGAKLALPVPRFDAISAPVVVGRDGKESVVVAAREPGGRVRVSVGGVARVVDGGAELVVADLDLDGTPELAVSSDSGEEAISVLSLERATEPKLRRRIVTGAPVRALAACPAEAKGVPALVAVVGTEVWLVR